jgi:hypothetical protein
VFGCGGDRDRGKRARWPSAASAAPTSRWSPATTRAGEDPLAIIAEIEAAMRGDYRVEVDRGEAIATAIASAAPGDCVLIAGKGHEDYQIIGTAAFPSATETGATVAVEERGMMPALNLEPLAARHRRPTPGRRCRCTTCGDRLAAAVVPVICSSPCAANGSTGMTSSRTLPERAGPVAAVVQEGPVSATLPCLRSPMRSRR